MPKILKMDLMKWMYHGASASNERTFPAESFAFLKKLNHEEIELWLTYLHNFEKEHINRLLALLNNGHEYLAFNILHASGLKFLKKLNKQELICMLGQYFPSHADRAIRLNDTILQFEICAERLHGWLPSFGILYHMYFIVTAIDHYGKRFYWSFEKNRVEIVIQSSVSKFALTSNNEKRGVPVKKNIVMDANYILRPNLSDFSDDEDTFEERIFSKKISNIVYYIGRDMINRRYILFRYNCKVFTQYICNKFSSPYEPSINADVIEKAKMLFFIIIFVQAIACFWFWFPYETEGETYEGETYECAISYGVISITETSYFYIIHAIFFRLIYFDRFNYWGDSLPVELPFKFKVFFILDFILRFFLICHSVVLLGFGKPLNWWTQCFLIPLVLALMFDYIDRILVLSIFSFLIGTTLNSWSMCFFLPLVLLGIHMIF